MISFVLNPTIANGTSLSGGIDCLYGRASRIHIPASWNAANLTFQTSADGTTYGDLYDASGAEYTVTAAAGRSVILPLSDFIGIQFMKVRSGTAGAAVNQGADRVLSLALVP